MSLKMCEGKKKEERERKDKSRKIHNYHPLIYNETWVLLLVEVMIEGLDLPAGDVCKSREFGMVESTTLFLQDLPLISLKAQLVDWQL